jgi:hypothetical protein
MFHVLCSYCILFSLASDIKEHAYRGRYEVRTAVASRITVFSGVTLSISVLKFRSSRLYLVGKESTDVRKDESDLGHPKS